MARLSPACCLVATLHGVAACSSSADGGPISHDQARPVRTTRADTIAATAACCGRSVAELQGGRWRFGWERGEQVNAPARLREKWWLLSHLSSERGCILTANGQGNGEGYTHMYGFFPIISRPTH